MGHLASSPVRTGAALAGLFFCSLSAGAQRLQRVDQATRDSVPDSRFPIAWLIGGSVVVAAAISDQELEEESLEYRSATLDKLEHTGNVLGSGVFLLPALGATYVAGLVVRQPRLTNGALHVAAAYLAGNIVSSVGKPAIGRHRPDTTGSPWRFRPLASQGAWHSLPSAHTLHAFTLAGAISEEARRPWVTISAYSAATLIGWSRVYADEHWTSDVAVSAILGAAIGHGVVRFLHARRAAGERVQWWPTPRGIDVRVAW